MENLLLLHGALGSKEQFRELKNQLAESYQVYCFNFSGHGGRPAHKNFDNELFTENILEFLNGNGIGQCSIFGYSMGGYVGLYFAKKYPQMINKVMTLATKFDWTPESAAREVKMLNPDNIAEKVPHFAKLLERRHAPQDWRKVLYKTADMMLELGNGKSFSENDLRAVACKTIITVGDADKMVTIAESKWATELIPNAILAVLPGVQHPIEKVDNKLLAETIKNFI